MTTTSPFRAGIAALVFASSLLAGCDEAAKFRGTDITGVEYGRSFALSDHKGVPRTLEDFRGKVVVLFFGYVYCPDVCPTTLAELAQVIQALGPDGERVQVLFITLDPERDTAELLGQYVAAFDPRFIALRGDVEATRRVAAEFKIFYEKRAGATPDSYSVDHSAQAYVIDPAGRLRLFVRHNRMAGDLPDDIRLLLRGR